MGNRLSKIYTRTGDDGTTGMADGSRVSKSDLVFEAMGDIDELNSHIGMIRALVQDSLLTAKDSNQDSNQDSQTALADERLSIIQHLLFNIGGELAMPEYQGVTQTHINWLEADIDAMNTKLPNLKDFILPAGSPLCAQVHIARTVCRRSERKVVALGLQTSNAISLTSQKFVNRLSDWLFVYAREVLRQVKRPEVLWNKDILSIGSV